ncbi:TolC family protein [Phenylobacterium sp.]|uniref:TolC family protein n=1 Tax=Phenylobacterium sp. TaxID=1871053 RepID=UPI00286CAB7B|nr:TolC family protein [Phenylobacterium sp.]
MIAASAVALAWLCPLAAAAAPAPPYAVLLRQAQGQGPRLGESAANVRAAKGMAEQAGARPNPVVGLDVEDIGRRDQTGIPQRQSTLSVSQAFELGGKRAARTDAGRADLSTAAARDRQAQADFAYDLANAYAVAEAAQRRVALLADDRARAREDLRATRALVDAGRQAGLRALQAQAAATAADAEFQAARADAAEAMARLSALVGAPEPFSSIDVSLLNAAASLRGAPAQLPAGAPAVAVAQAEREAAVRRIRVERTRAIPDITLRVGARRYEDNGDTALMAGVSAPLPLFDRNRGAVAAATAQLSAAEARLNGARLEAEAEWRAAAAQTSAGDVRLDAAVEGEAATREAYRLTRIGYEAGRTSLLELSAARRALVEAQTRLVEVQLARIRAEAVLARLAGRIPFGD